MFAKPFNLICVYVITLFNMLILLSPIIAISAPFINFKNNTIIIEYSVYQKIILVVSLVIFLVSFLMLFYLLLDFLFGFSMRSALKNCVGYQKVKDYDFLSGIFDQVKDKFGEKSVKLYVKNSNEINAYAVSSMGGKAIVLTRGLIDHYLKLCQDPKTFLYSLRSIMGHEMSHLVNKDFLPAFLIINNQKVTNLVSSLLHMVFIYTNKITRLLPYGGKTSARMIDDLYTLFNFLITSFNRFIVYNIYEFLRRFISRSIEYRADFQSARAFGGASMARALSMLGDSGYFTLFSTHPQTKRRINKVQNIKISDSIVRPRFTDALSNYISLMMLVIICLYFAKKAGVDLLVRQYIRNHEAIHAKLFTLWHLVNRIF